MKASTTKKQVILKRNEERRILAGHLWAFSNEVKETKGDPQIGDIVELHASGGALLGIGFYNPHSLICFRLLSSQVEEIDFHFFHKRISHALELRRSVYPDSQTFRVVNGESDQLPGLIIDKYNDIVCVQTLSYGMEIRQSIIHDVIESILQPISLVERNESPLRALENLPQRKALVKGAVTRAVIAEHGIEYEVDVLEGQKTGFFLDQRENRFAIRRLSREASVLDCFCNDGGFALNAIRGGARSVVGIDSSGDAIAHAQRNAEINDIEAARFERGDVFEKLKEYGTADQRFDVVVLDPPSFTRSRKNVTTAKMGYKELHASAFKVLTKGGILLTASCSHHISPDVFLDLVDQTALKAGRRAQLLDWRGAAPDHPVLPSMPETRYLKFGIFRIA